MPLEVAEEVVPAVPVVARAETDVDGGGCDARTDVSHICEITSIFSKNYIRDVIHQRNRRSETSAELARRGRT